MKKNLITTILSLFFLASSSVLAFQIPNKPVSYVNDYTNTLSKEQILSLEEKISNFEKQTSAEIVVVIMPSLDGDVIENVAQDIFTKWGLGKKDKNNGVLLLVAMNDRMARIHTGYGVEGDLPDLATSYIQTEVMIPAFKAGDYYTGINGALDKIIEALGGNNIVPEKYTGESKMNGSDWWHLFVFIFIAFQWLIAILSRSKSWWGGGLLGAIIAGGVWIFAGLSLFVNIALFIFLVVFGLVLDFFVSKAYQNHKNGGPRPPWFLGGFGGGHGGFGGGFGGFSGGSSGGGGSSSSW